jgi:nucleotide-binding universal stress UspA family protein
MAGVPLVEVMPRLRDRREDLARPPAERTRARPVVLATMAVRVHPSAERVALDSAIEAGVPLLVVNLVPLPPYVRTMVLVGPAGTTLPHEEALEEVRATARRAAELGVKTELLRVRTRHAATALLEVARERDAGLLVFGPDLSGISRLRSRAVERRIRRDADCLVWVAPEG